MPGQQRVRRRRRACGEAGPRGRGGSRGRPAPAVLPTRPRGQGPRRSRCRRRAGPARPRASGRRRIEDRARDELRLAADAPRRPRVVATATALDVDADQAHRQASDRGQIPVRGQGEVGVAAAEVDHAQRVLARGRAQVAGAHGVGDAGVEDAEELLDLAVLRLPAGLDPAVPVGQPEGGEDGVVLRQQPRLLAVVRPVGLGRCRPRRRVHDRVALLGDAQLVGLGRGVDVPVAERLGEQRGERTRSPRRPPGGWPCAPASRRTPSPGAPGRRGGRRSAARRAATAAARPGGGPMAMARTSISGSRIGAVTRASAASSGSLIASSPRRGRPAAPRPARPGSPAGDDEGSPLDPTDRPATSRRRRRRRPTRWCRSRPRWPMLPRWRPGLPRDASPAQSVQDQLENGQCTRLDVGERHPRDRVGGAVDLGHARLSARRRRSRRRSGAPRGSPRAARTARRR